jgi:Mg2+/Co2+ transporter CorB
MLTGDWVSLGVILICLALSFVLSASKTALTAFSRARLLRMEQAGDADAALVNRLMATRRRTIGAILIAEIVLQIAASALATGLLLAWLGNVGVFYAIAIMAVLAVVVTGVLPTTLAVDAPDRTAVRAARPVEGVVRLWGPVLAGIETLLRAGLRLLGFRFGSDPVFLSAHGERVGAFDLSHYDASSERDDRDPFDGTLDLRDLTVSDVMVHRTEIISVCVDDPPELVVNEVLGVSVTRVPLWQDRPENIVGVLHAKDLLRAIQAVAGDLSRIDLKRIASPPWFVPDIRPVAEQLKAFRRRRMPFALVVDEYGELMGLVTIEDILEEIVGDIADVHDVPVPGVRPQPDGSVNVDGGVPIRDLNRVMDWHLPDDEATTVAGLVIHEARSIPEPGQTFTFHGFRFRVLRRERNRVAALRITPLQRKVSVKAA